MRASAEVGWRMGPEGEPDRDVSASLGVSFSCPSASRLLLPVLLVPLLSTQGCPGGCSCHGNGTDCTGAGLLSLVSVMPLLQRDIQTLRLPHNNLSSLGGTDLSLSPLSQLEVLDLSHNLLSRLQPGTFWALANLRWLNLSANQLGRGHLTSDPSNDSSLRRDVFAGLQHLRGLDLSCNGLRWLPAGLLDGLQELSWLSLRSNLLGAVDRTTFDPLRSLTQLQLEENPWNCSCSLRSLRMWLEWLHYRDGGVDSVLCFLPISLRGRDIRSVPAEMFSSCQQGAGVLGPATRPPCHSNRVGGTEDCVRQRYRAVSVRRAYGTQVVAGVVCGTVCVMMLVAAIYGCVYASLMARYQRENKSRGQPLMVENDLDDSPALPLTLQPRDQPCIVHGYRISSF